MFGDDTNFHWTLLCSEGNQGPTQAGQDCSHKEIATVQSDRSSSQTVLLFGWESVLHIKFREATNLLSHTRVDYTLCDAKTVRRVPTLTWTKSVL